VPGCALTKEDTIEEEEIRDHGEATYEDSLRMVGGVESLGFRDYLITVLRLLVGAEIFREGEIFYLPLPGEELQVPQEAATSATSSKAGHSAAGASASTSAKRGYAYARSSASDSASQCDVDGSRSDAEERGPAKRWRVLRSSQTESGSAAGSGSKTSPSPPKASQSAPGPAPRAQTPPNAAQKRSHDVMKEEEDETSSLSSMSDAGASRPSKRSKIPRRTRGH